MTGNWAKIFDGKQSGYDSYLKIGYAEVGGNGTVSFVGDGADEQYDNATELMSNTSSNNTVIYTTVNGIPQVISGGGFA